MASHILIAALCLIPLASSMFLPPGFGHSFDMGFEAPDTKIIRRNAFGQLQAYDELSDPELYSNTVGGGFGSLRNPLMSAMGGFGNAGLSGRSFGATTGGLGTSAAGSLGAMAGNTLGAAGSGLNTLKMPLGMNTLNNYVGNYDPFAFMF